jgi:hypothetical protein
MASDDADMLLCLGPHWKEKLSLVQSGEAQKIMDDACKALEGVAESILERIATEHPWHANDTIFKNSGSN